MKQLNSFGVAGREFTDPDTAKDFTYTLGDGTPIPTPLVFEDNPFNSDVSAAKNILDFGCGIGRNLGWIMENTNAHYYGIDPNESMLQYFWHWQDTKWKNRVTLVRSFEELPSDVIFDVVVITFVFQHIGYRPGEGSMNIDDMTVEIRKFTKEGTVWIMYEHEGEERWMGKWFANNNIKPNVYFPKFNRIEPMIHRGLHDLIIWKETK